MIKLIIQSLKHGQVFKDFNNQNDLDLYIQEIVANEHWGRNARNEVITPAQYDESGSLLVQAQFQEIPAEWSYEIQDISAQFDRENQAKEALQYLKDTDWYVIRQMDSGVQVPEDIKLKRQEARLKI